MGIFIELVLSPHMSNSVNDNDEPPKRTIHPDARAKVRVMSAVARKLNSLREKAAMRSVEVANLLGTRPETVSRWKPGRAYPHAGTEKTLLELEYLVDQLADFYQPDEARQWMFAP